MERDDRNLKFAPNLTRRSLLKTTAGISAMLLFRGGRDAWADPLPGTVEPDSGKPMFQNPLFAGDFPDPSILRVGRDFYATHTSYSFAPGLVVWHSRDLVNWLPISHAIDSSPMRNEIWSPDLVEHGGRYFIYFPMGGVFVVYADHPRGPWSKPIDLKVNNIDPAHIASPDGRRFLYTSGGNAIELASDGLSTIGESKKVYNGWTIPSDWKTEGTWLESPKLTRRGKYYYLVCAEGGTAGPPTSHMSVVARSTSPMGPWENSPHNPLIHTYSEDEPWWSIGHGTLVSTPDERWYFVYHGYRKDFQSLGRNMLLEPIEWTEDGWPRAPLGTRRGDPMPAPMGVAQKPMIELSDDFKSPELRATWGAYKETDMSRYKTGDGALVMRAKGNSFFQSSPLTVKARDESYTVQVVAEIDGQSTAALALAYFAKSTFRVEFQAGQLTAFANREKLASQDWQEKTAWLRLVNRQNHVELLASKDGKDWQSLAADLDATKFNHNGQRGGFQAARPSIAAIGKQSVRFTDFRYAKI
jgi:xylan 1,4-beta-xylosidase